MQEQELNELEVRMLIEGYRGRADSVISELVGTIEEFTRTISSAANLSRLTNILRTRADRLEEYRNKLSQLENSEQQTPQSL